MSVRSVNSSLIRLIERNFAQEAGCDEDALTRNVQENTMHPEALLDALKELDCAIHKVSAVLEELRKEHDSLASYIFVSRRSYRATEDTKGGRRQEMSARLSFNKACALGFRGSLHEWERLMGAAASR